MNSLLRGHVHRVYCWLAVCVFFIVYTTYIVIFKWLDRAKFFSITDKKKSVTCFVLVRLMPISCKHRKHRCIISKGMFLLVGGLVIANKKEQCEQQWDCTFRCLGPFRTHIFVTFEALFRVRLLQKREDQHCFKLQTLNTVFSWTTMSFLIFLSQPSLSMIFQHFYKTWSQAEMF